MTRLLSTTVDFPGTSGLGLQNNATALGEHVVVTVSTKSRISNIAKVRNPPDSWEFYG